MSKLKKVMLESLVTQGVVPVKYLVPNASNPRAIRKDKLEKLKKSVVEDHEFLQMRPIVVDEYLVVLGGNQRLAAFKALGMEEIKAQWVVQAIGWSDEKKQAFIIKDNVGFGEWDWEALANDWDETQLAEWGLDIPELGTVDEQEDQDAGTQEDGLEKMSFLFSDEQADYIKQAIDQAKSSKDFYEMESFGNYDNQGNALALIVTQWLNNNSNI